MPKQIGWSNESNLLYQISQQITRLINVTGTSGGGSITGSGTANYITRWTSSSSLNSSVIYQSSTGNIGIGTTTPSQKLDVNGSTRIVGNMSVGSNGSAIPAYINGIYALDGLSQFKQINVSNGCITFNEGTAAVCGYSSSPGGVLTDYITINTNSVEQIRVLTNGNVGIGTSTPSQKLDVIGNIKGTFIIADNDLYGSNVRVNAFYANTLTYMPFNSNASPYGEIMRVDNGGSLLIGTTTPNGNKLRVVGTSDFISSSTAGQSIILGNVNFQWNFNTSIAPQILSLAYGSNNVLNIGFDAPNNLINIFSAGNIDFQTNFFTIGGSSNNPIASARFNVESTTKGSIPLPKMTTAQIKAIASPVNGLMAYSTDDLVPCFYDSNSSNWKKLSHTNL